MQSVRSTTRHFVETAGQLPGIDAVWTQHPGGGSQVLIAEDGCADLIVRVASGGLQVLIHRPRGGAHVARVAPGERVVGVRLAPGWGAPLLGSGVGVVAEAVRRFTPDVEVSDLETLIGEWLDRQGAPPRILRDFVAFAGETAGTRRLTDWVASARSERALQRAAKQWLGLTPKAFLRLERARSAKRAVARGEPLAHVAAVFQYADQSHMTRDFRTILGVTPRQCVPSDFFKTHGRARNTLNA